MTLLARSSWTDTACEPTVQAATMSSATSDNYNYTERVKQFADNWNHATSTWESDVVIPLQCGPFQPYESRKASKPSKFVCRTTASGSVV